jgi:hypothetical protein
MKMETQKDKYAYPGERFSENGWKIGVGQGMTMRDWFAGQAMCGIQAGYWSNPSISGVSPTMCANEAYQVADAMLAERKKETDT